MNSVAPAGARRSLFCNTGGLRQPATLWRPFGPDPEGPRGGRPRLRVSATTSAHARFEDCPCCGHLLQRANVPGFHPRALAERLPDSVARHGSTAADAGHDQGASSGGYVARGHSSLSQLLAGIHDQIAVGVGRDGIPATQGFLVIPAPDKIAIENVNSSGRIVRER